ncbi:MAG: hypothetical protein KME19_09005 [Microcoleus vaginatus WJT46-NPBG5]|nr:hypothetical protein [Microcoleus vaginatus WJT46-NPBG5]MBW4680239.1 hypothetical protein [Microcoleus vaginatus WJT46-NPBG5]
MTQQLIRNTMSGYPLNPTPPARAANWSIPLSVAVTSAAKVLIAANPNRTGLTITNKNPSEMYLRHAPFATLPVTTSVFDRIIPPFFSYTYEPHEVPLTEISALGLGTISGNWTVSESVI